MKYERFEDLPVWKAAIEVAARVYALTKNAYFAQPGDFRDQLRRASLSISNNIAEGFERGTTTELIAFLYIARGSAGEVRSMLRFVERDPGISNLRSEISNLRSEISNLISMSENCSRQIRGWADHLQNSEIKGQKHLTEKSRNAYDTKRAASDFMARLQTIVESSHDKTSSEMRGGS